MTGSLAVTGYAALFGIRDRSGDVIAPGAASRALRKGGRVRMLWQHDPRAVIGVWDAVREDARGILVRGRINTAIPRGREVADLITRSGSAGLSIGYRTIRASRSDEGRRLTEIELHEVSIVTDPMQPEARVAAQAAAAHNTYHYTIEEEADMDGIRIYYSTHFPQLLAGVVLETKAMHSGSGGDGGYLVSPQTAEGIGAVLRATGSLRSVARVVQVEASVFDVLIDRGEMGAGWAAESGTTTETSTGTLQKISIPVHELAAMPKVSQRLLDDAAFDVESWIAERIGEKFARAEAAAFISGDGSNKPKGFLDHTKVANGSWAWGSLGYVAGGNASAITSTDALVDVVYALEAPYRAGAVWVMNSRTAGALRKLKDDDGRYLWADRMTQGEPDRLFGYGVFISEDMPDVGANAFPVAFGDFKAGYTVVERPGLRIRRDEKSAKPNVLFYATRRVGGGVTDFAAIKLLKVAV